MSSAACHKCELLQWQFSELADKILMRWQLRTTKKNWKQFCFLKVLLGKIASNGFQNRGRPLEGQYVSVWENSSKSVKWLQIYRDFSFLICRPTTIILDLLYEYLNHIQRVALLVVFITECDSTGGNAIASVRLSIRLFPLYLPNLWSLHVCVGYYHMARRDWNWRSQVKVKTRSVWPRSSSEDSFLVGVQNSLPHKRW